MIYIIITGILWALDGVFRAHLTVNLNSINIVLYEHLVGVIILLELALIFKKQFKIQKIDSSKDYLIIILLAIISGFLGTYFFTESFALSASTGDFITPVLLQKLQPIFVLILSIIFLKEKLTKNHYISIFFTIIGSYLLIVGWNTFNIDALSSLKMTVYAILAALFWGMGTIISKKLLKKYNHFSVTTYRFVATVLVALPISLITTQNLQINKLTPIIINNISLIAISSGMVAILLYYNGLKQVKAFKSSIYELSYPITAFIIGLTSLNPYGDAQIFELDKFIGALIIIGTMIYLSRTNKE